jgi:hypothetical protein
MILESIKSKKENIKTALRKIFEPPEAIPNIDKELLYRIERELVSTLGDPKVQSLVDGMVFEAIQQGKDRIDLKKIGVVGELYTKYANLVWFSSSTDIRLAGWAEHRYGVEDRPYRMFRCHAGELRWLGLLKVPGTGNE